MILANILSGGYEGKVYPVNPKADEILGLRACPSVTQVSGDLDLVVVVVPATFVPQVLREAAGKGAGAAIVISGGFRESGRGDPEEELKDIVRETGMRIVAPGDGVRSHGRDLAKWDSGRHSGGMGGGRRPWDLSDGEPGQPTGHL